MKEKGKENLKIGDIVYFRKVTNELSSSWTLGKVVDFVRSKDGVVRCVTIEYQNASKFPNKRKTDRAARSMIKLFHIEDKGWCQEMANVDTVLEEVRLSSSCMTIRG